MSNDESNKVRIFASDDNLKSLGELLSNETSRKIITNLMSNEMYTNEIATKLDIRVSLVIHHLRKLEDLGLLEIQDKKIKRKGEDHKFFKMSSDIFITLNKNKEDIESKNILQRIFRDGIKFTSIGVISLLTLFFTVKDDLPQDGIYLAGVEDYDFTITLIVLVIGLILERIIFGIKKRKREVSY